MIDVFVFDGKVRKGKLKDAYDRVWIDITGMTRQEMQEIRKTFSLHPLTVEDMAHSRTRVKVEEFPHYLFCVFYALLDEKSHETYEIDFILSEQFIITNHVRAMPVITALKKDPERMAELFKKGNDFFLHYLLDHEVDDFFPYLERTERSIEKLEQQVVKAPTPKLLSHILETKRSLGKVRRTLFSMREKVSFLARGDCRFITKSAQPYYRDVYDHLVRISDGMDSAREAVAYTFDVYMSAMSNNLSEVMKFLSIIATISVPLTVISGIYGTNFSFLPGADASYGFFMMLLLMGGISGTMLYFFKKKKWW